MILLIIISFILASLGNHTAILFDAWMSAHLFLTFVLVLFFA